MANNPQLNLGVSPGALDTPPPGQAALGFDAAGALVTKNEAGDPVPVAFPKLLAHPTTPTDKAFGYCLEVLGVDQFFVKTEDGTVYQITPPPVGGGGALPFVIVSASQAAPAGFTYLVVAAGVTLTLAPGVSDDRFALANLFNGPIVVVADPTAPDLILGDAGSAAPSFTADSPVPLIRTWQFAGPSISNAWLQTSREPFASDEGSLPFADYAGTTAMGVMHIVISDPGAPVVLPQVAAHPNARIAVYKGYPGPLTIEAFAGENLTSSVDGALVVSEDAGSWAQNSMVEYQNRAGEPQWRLVKKVVFGVPPRGLATAPTGFTTGPNPNLQAGQVALCFGGSVQVPFPTTPIEGDRCGVIANQVGTDLLLDGGAYAVQNPATGGFFGAPFAYAPPNPSNPQFYLEWQFTSQLQWALISKVEFP